MSTKNSALVDQLNREETLLVTPTIPVQSARLIIAALATLAKDGYEAWQETQGTPNGVANDHTMNLIAVTIGEIATAGSRVLPDFTDGITQYGIEAYAGPEITKDLERRRDNFRTPESREALYADRGRTVTDAFNSQGEDPLTALLRELGISASDSQ